jgi:transposase
LGTPLGGYITSPTENDYSHLLSLVDELPHPPGQVWADRGYDKQANITGLTQRGITPKISRRRRPGQGKQHRDPQGRHRSAVERTHSWIKNFRRLDTRWEVRDDLHQGFYKLGLTIICLRIATRPSL